MRKLITITLSTIIFTLLFIGTANAESSGAECKDDNQCHISGEQCIEGYCFAPMDLLLFKSPSAPEIAKLPDVSQENLFKTIFKTILGASMLLTIAAIVIAAIFYIISQGNDEDISKAKNIILYLIIGLVIMAAAYGLVSGIIQFDFFKAST